MESTHLHIGERQPENRLRDIFRCPVPLGQSKRKLEFTADVLNLLNLFNSDWGKFDFTPNQSIAPIRYGGTDAATGKPIYDISTITSPTFSKLTLDDLRSRWQAQIGARFRF